MRKFTALILALALSLTLTAAFAETKTFGLAGITDREGTPTYLVREDNTVVDVEGNPTESVPYCTITIDDQALRFEMNVVGQSFTGSVEVLEIYEDSADLLLTPDFKSDPLSALYSVNDGNTLTIFNEANDQFIVLTEIA